MLSTTALCFVAISFVAPRRSSYWPPSQPHSFNNNRYDGKAILGALASIWGVMAACALVVFIILEFSNLATGMIHGDPRFLTKW